MKLSLATSEFEASLGYMRPYVKDRIERQKGREGERKTLHS